MSVLPRTRWALDGARKSSRSFTKVSDCFLLIFGSSGFRAHGDYKKILMELIEEDFTGRAFDNVKAIHSLVKVVEADYARGVGQF